MGIHALYTASTGMDAQLKHIDVIANNVANLETQGFRKDRVNFADLFYRQHAIIWKEGWLTINTDSRGSDELS